jgi:hypothetical protein
MNSPHSQSELSRILAEWTVAPPRDPQFRAGVWQRLQRARRPVSWTGYARNHVSMLAGATAIALVLGAWVGREQARSRVAAERAQIVAAYVESLDARAMRMP